MWQPQEFTDELGVDMHAIHPTLATEATKHLVDVNRNLAHACENARWRRIQNLTQRLWLSVPNSNRSLSTNG